MHTDGHNCQNTVAGLLLWNQDFYMTKIHTHFFIHAIFHAPMFKLLSNYQANLNRIYLSQPSSLNVGITSIFFLRCTRDLVSVLGVEILWVKLIFSYISVYINLCCVPFGFPAPVPLCSRVMLPNPMGAYRFHYCCHKSCVVYHCSKLRLFNPETRPHKFEVKP